ncbi:DsbA family protein [Halobacteriaceae archaeon GCM10025711]
MRKVTRRRALATTGSALLAGLAGCASVADQVSSDETTTSTTLGNQSGADGGATTTTDASGSNQSEFGEGGDESTQETTVDASSMSMPDGPLASASIPDEPGDATYAIMGSEDADVTARLFGSWKCPYTRDFVTNQLDGIVRDYVEPGDVAIEYRAVAYYRGDPFLGADAPRSARAGLSVWHTDPESYWEYFATVFANQPPERYKWGTVGQLLEFVEAADVSQEQQIRSAITSGEYEQAVRANTEAALEEQITTVPRLVVDGTVTAPTVDPEQTKRVLDRATE